MSKAMEHLRSLTSDPDILFKHAANYALRLTSGAPEDKHVYVAALDEEEEDELAGEDAEGAEDAEPPAEEPPAEGEGDAATTAAGFDYSQQFFRYVSAAGKKGKCEWIVGKTLRRGEDQGVTYSLVDPPAEGAKTPPWIDIPNVLTHQGPGKMRFLKGFPRVGAYFAVPIVLATGEVEAVLCVDTLKTPAGGTGRPISEADKKIIREVAAHAAAAMNAAAEMRAAALALAPAEQAALAEALAAAEAPETGEPGEGEEGAPTEEPATEQPPIEPEEGEDEAAFEARKAKAEAVAAAAAADDELKKKSKRLACVAALIGEMNNDALAEVKSYRRAPKATFKAVKACLYLLGHKKYEFESWPATRKLLGASLIEEVKAADPAVPLSGIGEKGVKACLKGLTDADVSRESKAGSVIFKWVECFRAAGIASAAAQRAKDAVTALEAAEAAAAAPLDPTQETAAEGGEAAAEGGEAPSEAAPAE